MIVDQRENIDDENTNLHYAFHPTLGSQRCCYKPLIPPPPSHPTLNYSWIGDEHCHVDVIYLINACIDTCIKVQTRYNEPTWLF